MSGDKVQALAFINDVPGSTVIEALFAHGLFVPIDAPACAAELDVPAAATDDNQARHFICDRAAGHHEADGTIHRQVTDRDVGSAVEWADDTAAQIAAALAQQPEDSPP
ncbi:hypothetical protein [Nocardia sp. NPDC051832]|uniref:hypothetical protein n=1 Tax=Nocardia sp. NPDC051832 TaxID=3155673 RepID=UPI00343EF7EE